MKKHYVKMNDNKKYLSLGNIISCIKRVSNNKSGMQLEIFSSIFDVNNINTTTVNNYCIGIRAIGLEYRKSFSDKYLLYKENNNAFINVVLSIISILDDRVYLLNENSLDEINNNTKLKEVINELLTIANNDKNVSKQFINNIKTMNSYDSIIELLNYAINVNKQPIYIQNINIEINKSELNEYLKVKLYYGQSYISSLIYLSNKDNMYASADLGSLWFDGAITGEVDYQKSYEYYLKAANKNHPKACWMIANLILTKRVKYNFNTMWKYLNKAIELGSAAGYNTMGLCYKNGITPDNKKDIDEAIKYFKLSSELGYVFAFNNLGYIYENNNDIENAIKYYKISADMNDSWALNKVGEYYRKNNDLDKAFIYYSKSIESPLKERSAFGYYNLAEYYYKNKDDKKYQEYMEMYNKLKTP